MTRRLRKQETLGQTELEIWGRQDWRLGQTGLKTLGREGRTGNSGADVKDKGDRAD